MADAEDDLAVGLMGSMGTGGVHDDPSIARDVVFHDVMHLGPERLIAESEDDPCGDGVCSKKGAGEVCTADIVAIDKKSGEGVLSEEDFQVELQEE